MNTHSKNSKVAVKNKTNKNLKRFSGRKKKKIKQKDETKIRQVKSVSNNKCKWSKPGVPNPQDTGRYLSLAC